MLRFDDIVFGPIASRRLGVSLGINLLPRHGKLCDFDCIYCECGWNRDGHTAEALPDSVQIASALEVKLSKLAEEGVCVDSITFSGHGEPTLHPQFASIVDVTLALRDKYMPKAKVSVLSNATMLDDAAVFAALKKVDNPILKLDAGTDEGVRAINRPASPGYSVSNVVRGLQKFDGDFILQTMFLRPAQSASAAPDFERDAAELAAWMDCVRRTRPRQIMVYTLDRPAPDQGLEKMGVQTMRSLLQPLVDEGFNIQING